MEFSYKAISAGVILSVYSSLASALGLGEIKLNSALNQPLEAEIELLHVRELTAREIMVMLAEPDDFQRAGVDRIYFLTDFKFDVDLNAPGGPVVKVTSTKPVREPFLDFIVSARWPSGRLLREYTLLIDLPIFTDGAPQAVAAVKKTAPTQPVSQPKTTTRNEPRPRATPPPAPRTSPVRSEFDSDEYGPVGANENLWSIASRVRPDQDVSVQQTMLAIQRLNPDAFINGNINLLRRGQILRIPDRDEILGLNPREAIREVATQNSAWQNKEEVAAPQLEGSKSISPTNTESQNVEGRIKLSSSEDTSERGDGIATGDGESGNSAIESDLAFTQEELDAANREGDDIKSRIESMEEQIETMEKLIEVSSDELRALELAAAQNNETLAATEGETAETQDDTQQTAPAITEEPAVEVSDATSSQEQVKPTPAPVQPAPAAKGTDWMQLVQDNLVYIAGGAIGLIALLAGFLFMRRRDDGFDDDFDDQFEDVQQDFLAQDEPLDEEEFIEPLQEDFDDLQDEVEEDIHSEAETEDVVGECDIHIAYGQYEQAEDKLEAALEKEPTNIPARLKLLEVFVAQDKLAAFDANFAKIKSFADSDSVNRAAQLREGFAGAAPFDDSSYESSALLEGLDGESPGQDDETSFDQEDTELSLDEDDTLDFSVAAEDSLSIDGDEITLEGDSNDLDIEFDIEDESTIVPDVAGEAEPEISADLQANETSDLDGFAELDDELAGLEFDLPEEDLVDVSDDEADDTLIAGLDDSVADESDFDDLDLSLDDEVSASADLIDTGLDSGTVEDEFADLDLSLDDTGDINALDDEGSSSTSDAEGLDFDLEKDLEDAMQVESDAAPEKSSGDDLMEMDFEGLGEIDLEEESSNLTSEADSQSETEMEAFDTSLDLEDAEIGQDFDSDINLDGDIDLAELDKELGELDLEEVDAIEEPKEEVKMEEPDLSFETDASSSEQELPEIDLDQVAADASNVEVDVEPVATQDFEIPEFDPENDDDSNLEFLTDNDETATKLDLARAYIDMGDADGARDILDEIFEEGNDSQKKEAETLLAKLA